MEQWFAVKTHPKREQQVKSYFTAKGIEVYLPLKPKQGSRVLEPLFPGYLFSRLEVGSAVWPLARYAQGVSYFLGAEGVPSPLPDELIENLQQKLTLRAQEGWEPRFQPGDRVSMSKGPFAGLEAVFESTLSAAGRVRVLLETLGRVVRLDLSVEFLQRGT